MSESFQTGCLKSNKKCNRFLHKIHRFYCRLSVPKKGLNIINGKKVIVK